MKTQLLDHIIGTASHHACCAKACKAVADKFSSMGEMSKVAEGELHGVNIVEACDELSKQFSIMSDSHVEQGEACAKFAELLQSRKTLDEDQLNKLMPSNVSAVAPPANDNTKPLHRAISRAGAPTLADKAEGATLVFTKVWGED